MSKTTPLPKAHLADLVSAGRMFHARGWVPATAGNFSVRLSPKSLAVTVSGRHKGELAMADFMAVDLDGKALGKGKSSAETLLHCQLYRHSPEAGAVLHTHSPASTVLSRAHDTILLEGYELLKIFEGIQTHDAAVEVPVFENDQDIARLSRVVDAHMRSGQAAHAYLIRGHGLYAWGRTVAEARHRVEALEFLFECELNERLLKATGE
ncbi:MAG TPA: methylthioribulose 1-phosphate dehydratase [Verrucomicrobiae bacterium]|nr:methylthioribulose 1-phosphate dehydratase [Verrucomicrobiae bacterium]